MSEVGAALVTGIGTLLGVLIGSLLTFWLQRKQRRWALEDQRQLWKRERLQTQVDSVLRLISGSVTQLMLLEEELRRGRTDFHQHLVLKMDDFVDANTASIILGDAELGALLYEEYASVLREVRQAYEQGNLTEDRISVYLRKAQLAAQNAGKRAEVLIDGA